MAQTYTTIIEVDELARHLGAPTWRVMDCRFDLMDKSAGRQAYTKAHIPGALYAHLEEELSGPVSEKTGRHPLPEAAALAECFSRWGIGNDSQLVVYDDRSGALASRLWWLSRWLGHPQVAVLNGGLAAWQAAGLPLSRELPVVEPASFRAEVDDTLWVSTDELQTELDDENIRLIDARGEARFRGEVEPLDRVAGHIPGSINYPFERNLDASGKFLTPQEIQGQLSGTVTDFTGKKIIHSCGSGVTACHNILAMEIMGLSGSLLYPGSWSEWITDPARAISRGKES